MSFLAQRLRQNATSRGTCCVKTERYSGDLGIWKNHKSRSLGSTCNNCRQMIATGTVMEGGNAGKWRGKLSHRLGTAMKRAMR